MQYYATFLPTPSMPAPLAIITPSGWRVGEHKAFAHSVAKGTISDGGDMARPWIKIMLERSRLVVIERSIAIETTQEILGNFRRFVSVTCAQRI